MKPVSPVFEKRSLPEVVFAKDQPEYQPLPAYRSPSGVVTSRWKLSLRERLRLLFSGNLWLSVLTFHRPLQPIWLDTEEPEPELHEAEMDYLQGKTRSIEDIRADLAGLRTPPGPPDPPRNPKDKPVG